MNGGTTPVRVTARAVQIGLGIIWVVDGLLQLQPKMFGTGFADNVILPSAQGQPGIVSGMITHLAHLMSAQPVLTDLVFAGIQLLIGAGLLLRETVKPALVLSFVWALGVWSVGEGFGGLLTGTAQPLTGAPGAALLYLAIALLVWPKKEPREVDGPAAAEGLLGVGGGLALWAVVWCGLGILWLLPASSGSGALSSAAERGGFGRTGLAGPPAAVGGPLPRERRLGRRGRRPPVLLHRGGAADRPALRHLPDRRRGDGPRHLGARPGLRADLHRDGHGPQHRTAPHPVGADRVPERHAARAPDRLSPEPSTGTGVLTPRPASAGRGR